MASTYVDYDVDEEGAKFKLNVSEWGNKWVRMSELPEEIQERLSLMLVSKGADIDDIRKTPSVYAKRELKGVGIYEIFTPSLSGCGWFIFPLDPNDFKEIRNGNNT